MFKQAFTVFGYETLRAVRRFPLPVLFSILFCITAVRGVYHYPPDHSLKTLAIAFCGCFWFIAATLFGESRGWNALRTHLLALPVFLIIGWHLWCAPAIAPVLGFLGTGIFLLLFVAPFLRQNTDDRQIWQFNYGLWSHIAFTFFAAIVLYLGIEAIILSLEFLFGFHLYANISFDVWLVVATMFSPLVAMAGIPRQFDAVATAYPRAKRIILTNIAIPLLLLYALLLYSYIAKIILTGELPKGGVAYLVSGFGCAGIVVYLASYPLHASPGIISLFRRAFPIVLIAPLILFAVGLNARISQYGITEERYAVLLSLVWLTLSVVFIYRRHSLKHILFSAIFLLLAASFGPWGAVEVSAASQKHRLEQLLIRNGMLVNGFIRPAAQNLSPADRVDIMSIADYLTEANQAARLAPWFASLTEQPDYTSAAAITDAMGIVYIAAYERNREDLAYRFSFRSPNPMYMAVSGYDYLTDIDMYLINQQETTRTLELGTPPDAVTVSIRFDATCNCYTVQRADTQESLTFELGGLISQWDRNHKGQSSDNDLPFQLELQAQHLKARLIVKSFTGNFADGNAKPKLDSLSASFLLSVQ